MKIESPRWMEFIDALTGPEGCNFREEDGRSKWDCGGGWDQSKARKILESMGIPDGEIADTLQYAREHGGHCDCEIVLNVSGEEEIEEEGGAASA